MIVESSPSAARRHSRAARLNGQQVGLVPTMGALHAGHGSLIQAARAECDFVVATIFVNPTQFGPNEDFSRYPRTLEADLQLCRDAGADLVFTPTTQAMYGSEAQTSIRVQELSGLLEGAHRPGHFDGVSTIVAKLFHITEPDRAYFGQKDYQQQLIIRRMAEDLDFATEIITCPIVREADGLAMSSRNRYLSPTERQMAGQLFQALQLACRLANEASRKPPEIAERMRCQLIQAGGIDVDYATIVHGTTLQPLQERDSHAVALIAARVGSTRLIDNQILQFL